MVPLEGGNKHFRAAVKRPKAGVADRHQGHVLWEETLVEAPAKTLKQARAKAGKKWQPAGKASITELHDKADGITKVPLSTTGKKPYRGVKSKVKEALVYETQLEAAKRHYKKQAMEELIAGHTAGNPSRPDAGSLPTHPPPEDAKGVAASIADRFLEGSVASAFLDPFSSAFEPSAGGQ